jgi:MFS family permease
MASGSRARTLEIIPAVAFTSIAYFSIGILLAILPSYVHLTLGMSTTVAGLLVSLQYIATFASRPAAGRLSDTIGPRRTVRYGLASIAGSGVLLGMIVPLRHSLWLGMTVLVASRLALGVGESLTSTGSTLWGIARVGHEYTAQVISWNGVATYVALAISAPLGITIEAHWGLSAVGGILFVLGLVGLFGATRMPATVVAVMHEAVDVKSILRKVSPFGIALALGSNGFGVIATFLSLYFAQRHWNGAAFSLSAYGTCFICGRLFFSGCIQRFGGFNTVLVSLMVESAGLLLLAFGHTQQVAYISCGLTGIGFSLVFPALGVEAANAFPASVRGTVLGIYSAFVDFSLFLTGPLLGTVIGRWGYRSAFLTTIGGVVIAFVMAWMLRANHYRRMTMTPDGFS